VAEQRYEAVRAVIADGATVTEVASWFEVARKTVHAWLAKYEAGGLEGLVDRSHRSRTCPHQMPTEVKVALAGLRLAHPSWGPRRLVFELAKAGVAGGALAATGLWSRASRDAANTREAWRQSSEAPQGQGLSTRIWVIPEGALERVTSHHDGHVAGPACSVEEAASLKRPRDRREAATLVPRHRKRCCPWRVATGACSPGGSVGISPSVKDHRIGVTGRHDH